MAHKSTNQAARDGAGRKGKITLFSYVVEHDYGHAPNPYSKFCTLVRCKFRKAGSNRRNIVELANEGDWIVGTGGANPKKSAGHGSLIFAMKVEEKRRLREYWSKSKFKDKKPIRNGNYAQRRGDNKEPKSAFEKNERYALVSWDEWYYFGNAAKQIPREFRDGSLGQTLETGRGFKSDFSQEFIGRFLNWLSSRCEPGKSGEPCGKEFKESKEMKKLTLCKSSC
jgi:hypothetical protein